MTNFTQETTLKLSLVLVHRNYITTNNNQMAKIVLKLIGLFVTTKTTPKIKGQN